MRSYWLGLIILLLIVASGWYWAKRLVIALFCTLASDLALSYSLTIESQYAFSCAYITFWYLEFPCIIDSIWIFKILQSFNRFIITKSSLSIKLDTNQCTINTYLPLSESDPFFFSLVAFHRS